MCNEICANCCAAIPITHYSMQLHIAMVLLLNIESIIDSAKHIINRIFPIYINISPKGANANIRFNAFGERRSHIAFVDFIITQTQCKTKMVNLTPLF